MKAWLAIVFAVTASSAAALETCTKVERGQFLAALDRAERLTLTAATAIGPNPTFDRWFGPYTPKHGEIVRKTLKSMVTAMRSGEITAACRNVGQGLCETDVFAFVNLDDALVIHLCPSFFEMDTMKQLSADTVAAGNGTRAGTIVHEISHFEAIAGTEDLCYSREDCSEMARRSPREALINADSYQYFVEDVTFFGVRGESRTDQ